jgi:MFS family permease
MNKFQAPPHILSYIQTFTAIPWYIKPIFGLITDLLPICGYRRKIYIILMGLLQCLCLIMLKYICLNVYYAIMLFFLINVSLSFSSIISQAIFVELGQNHKKQKGEDDAQNLNSLYTFYKYMGIFIASLFKGILVEKFSIENVFLIASVFPTIVIIAGFVFD